MCKQIATFAITATVAFLIFPLSLSSQNSFSLSLDANSAAGDQAVTSVNTSADQNVSIQVFGSNVQNANAFGLRFEYDTGQVTYQGFDSGSVLPGTPQILPQHGTNPPHVEIGLASLGSQATVNSGLVGTIRFRTTAAFSGTAIRLVSGKLSRGSNLETVTLTARVELQAGSVTPSPDFDGDGTVSISDFLLFVNHFGLSRGDAGYDAQYDLDSNDGIGISDFLIFVNNFGSQAPSSGGGGSVSSPDLIVVSPSVSDTTLTLGQSITLSATVRNQGSLQSAATTLRYYRSTDATISTNDTPSGMDEINSLSASGTSSESIRLTAPNTAGTYYYGACVESVSGESNTANNCSSGVRVTVEGGNTFDQTVAQIQTLEAELEQNRKRVEQEIAQQKANHPLNAPKNQFESDTEYAARLSQLDLILIQSRQELVMRYRLEDTQTQIVQLYRKTFPTNDVTVTLGTYNANVGYFPITFEVTLNGENRLYNSRLTINRDDARSLFKNWDKVIAKGYLVIGKGYRRALAWIGLEYTPIWPQGIWWPITEVYYNLGDNNQAVAFSPDGKYIATATQRDQMATLWDLKSGRQIRQMEHGTSSWDHVYAVAFSPDGRYLATGGEDYTRYSNVGKTVLWDLKSGRQIRQMEHNDEVMVVTFSPDGRYIATTTLPYSNRNATFLWETSSGRFIRGMQYIGDSGTIYAVAFSPDGKYLATGNRRYYSNRPDRATIWEVKSGRVMQQIEHTGKVVAVAFSPDGKYLATGSAYRYSKGLVTLWEVTEAQVQRNHQALLNAEHANHIHDTAFSPDGKYLAVAEHGKIITIYRIPTEEITLTTKMDIVTTIYATDIVGDLAWSPDGRFISDGKKVYRVHLQRPNSATRSLSDGRFISDGKKVYRALIQPDIQEY